MSEKVSSAVNATLAAFFSKLWPFLLLGVVLLVVAALYKAKRKSSPTSSAPAKSRDLPIGSYRKQSYILSKAELTFLNVLRQAAPPHTVILTQVALQRLIAVGRDSGSRRSDWNRISQKHVDFVLCDEWTRPLAVIELDDSSHQRERGKNRDSLVDAALGSAGIRAIHVPAANGYDASSLRATLVSIATVPNHS